MTQISDVADEARSIKKSQQQLIQQISKKSAFPWLPHALCDWGVIGASLYCAAALNNPAAYFLTLLIIGNRQHALAILGHEGAHFTIHDNKMVNDFLANFLCFWPVLMTVEGYRTLHFTHHKNTGTVNDPELMHKRARAPQWDLPINRKKLALYAFKDFFGYSIPDLIIILTFSRPEKKYLLIPPIVLNLAVLSVLVMSGFWWIATLWYGAMATSFMMFFRLRLCLEHQGTYDTQRVHLNWWQGHLLAPHNIWLHWEHHRWPTVPYHRLKQARELASDPQPLALGELARLLENSAPMVSGAALDHVSA